MRIKATAFLLCFFASLLSLCLIDRQAGWQAGGQQGRVGLFIVDWKASALSLLTLQLFFSNDCLYKTCFPHMNRQSPVSSPPGPAISGWHQIGACTIHLHQLYPPYPVLQAPCFALACSSILHQDLRPHPSVHPSGCKGLQHTQYTLRTLPLLAVLQDQASSFSRHPSFLNSFQLLH